MPSEFRFIVFRPNEAAKALVLFAQKTGRKLPAGKPLSAEPTSGSPPNGTLWIETEAGQELPVPFDSRDIASALLMYCISNKIPLPRESEKVLEYFKRAGSLLFAMRIGIFPEAKEKNRAA
ncbi:MAG: hypothetical protein NXI19_19980 [Alphaproteobacteria bacterium]|nr:hypothetical protein [Alphaproteobacteria bacterium]